MSGQAQLKAQITRGLEPLFGLLLQAMPYDLLELWRYLRNRWRVLLQNRVHGLDARVARKGPPARQHLVQNRPQRENVRPMIGRLPLHLLRRHIGIVPGSTRPATWHFQALQTSYISPPGDFTASEIMPVDSTKQAWFWLAGVEVMASKQTGAIVVFGDSITDGTRSTPDTNNRWPDQLARRLMDQPGNHKMGVLNEGIAGNRVLHDIIGPNALARFDRDVLNQTRVTHVIVLLGGNDIGFEAFRPAEAVTPGQIIEGHRQFIARAHAPGLKIYGGTLTPFELLSPAQEAKRQEVNRWIRTSGEYDAVIDFDAVLRDPSFPTRLNPDYDSGDHLHPNDLGYKVMANAIDLKLFKNGEGH